MKIKTVFIVFALFFSFSFSASNGYAFNFLEDEKKNVVVNNDVINNAELSDFEKDKIDKEHGIVDFDTCAKISAIILKTFPPRCKSKFSNKMYIKGMQKEEKTLKDTDSTDCTCDEEMPSCPVECNE